MEKELLKIFDENFKVVGEASRADVHRLGHWHETFHCWFIGKEDDVDYIFFQIRSDSKKDYPGLLDITAAGHLLFDESVEDGIREVQEELGIDVKFKDVISLGIVKNVIISDDIIDKEFSHVFLYRGNFCFDDFRLQEEEVTGIVRAQFRDFENLCLSVVNEIVVEGFEVTEVGERSAVRRRVKLNSIVPHQPEYNEVVVKLIRKQLY